MSKITPVERLVWMRDVGFGWEDDGNTPKYKATGIPENDPVLVGAVALIEKYGGWYDPVLSPETVIEMVDTIFEALIASHQKMTEALKGIEP